MRDQPGHRRQRAHAHQRGAGDRDGRQYDKEIVATLGLYPDSGLQRYLQQLGAGIAAQSERPGLPWTFRVVDDPTVNAFAVPGGFVYVTRGIMAHLNSEAQLASVVGHEIGHITARHTARSLSRQQLAQIGLAVGSIASERFAQFADLASTGLGVLFLKFSRDDESQADALGLRYLQRTAFDVREMPGVFDMLEQLSAAAGGAGRVPEWLATHPTPADRRTRIDRAIAALPQDFTGKVVNRDSYERRLDGMVFGADPRQGYFDGTRFLHPGLRFHFTFPAGWATENGAQAVRAMSAEQDAAVELTFAREATAAAASQAFLTQEGIRAGPSQRASFSGLPAVVTPFATTSGDAMQGTVAFVEHGNAVYRLLGFAPAARWAARRAVAEQSLRSFAVLTDPVALDMQPQRVSSPRARRQLRYPYTQADIDFMSGMIHHHAQAIQISRSGCPRTGPSRGAAAHRAHHQCADGRDQPHADLAARPQSDAARGGLTAP
jgi:predicted Zn-dependent protease